jgi:uroporphyrin-3 C-methyltransferase
MNKTTDDTGDAADRPAPAAVTQDSPATPLAADPDTGDHPPGTASPGRGFSSVAAWLALLLALLSLASSAYLAWQTLASGREESGNEAAITALAGELDQTATALRTRQQAALAELEDAGRQSAEDVAALERELDELVRRNESIAPRVAGLESAISSLQGVSAGARDTWMLAEAEYYMQVANAQLQLAGNPRIAALALDFADERIREMANPALAEVRRALAQEKQALASMETADIEGMTLALASLAERTAAFPLKANLDMQQERREPVDSELTGFSRAVASVKRAFGDIVSVRRTDAPLAPLLSPDAAYFLRANLALQFQAARLALLKGEQEVFEQSLSDAQSWLREYYDSDSGAVAGALDTLAQLRDSGIGAPPPDISGSLRLLRQYRTLNSAESPANDDDDSGNGGRPESAT